MRRHPRVLQHLSATSPADCVISTISQYELLVGVAKCAHPAKEQAKVDLLVQTVKVLPFDIAAAEQAAHVRAYLDAQGTPIGPYDMLLAGHALSLSLILVTNNVQEFQRVPGLIVENWHV
jgi:tRNA(fMet)-specific endonuclease VapC